MGRNAFEPATFIGFFFRHPALFISRLFDTTSASGAAAVNNRLDQDAMANKPYVSEQHGESHLSRFAGADLASAPGSSPQARGG